MYCIQCGVKLADTEKQCPLCGLTVYHPELKQGDEAPLFPKNAYPEVAPRSLLPQIILTALFLIPINIVLLVDSQVHSGITWSGYVVGALLLSYVLLVLPSWFSRPNPVIFVPSGFAAIGLYLLYINCATGGSWFLSFALPVTGITCLLVTAVVALMRYVPKGGMYIFGGAFIAFGLFALLIEFLLNITFQGIRFVGWSLYPLASLVILGGLLIFLAICRPAREKLERKLFL